MNNRPRLYGDLLGLNEHDNKPFETPLEQFLSLNINELFGLFGIQFRMDVTFRFLMPFALRAFPRQLANPNVQAMLGIIKDWEAKSIDNKIHAFEFLYCAALKNGKSLEGVFAKFKSSDNGLGLFTDKEGLMCLLSHFQDDTARWSLAKAAQNNNSTISANYLYGASGVTLQRMKKNELSYAQARLLQNKPLWIFMLQVKVQEPWTRLPGEIFMMICEMITDCDNHDDLFKIYEFMCMVTHEGAKTIYNNAWFWTRMFRTTTLADIDQRYDDTGCRITATSLNN